MGGELGLLMSISLSGYAMAFAIIALIVAIPYLLLRREALERSASPQPLATSAAPESASKELGVSDELLAAAVAAAMYVHASRAKRFAKLGRGYAPTSSWVVAARMDQVAQFERGWGERKWRGYRF